MQPNTNRITRHLIVLNSDIRNVPGYHPRLHVFAKPQTVGACTDLVATNGQPADSWAVKDSHTSAVVAYGIILNSRSSSRADKVDAIAASGFGRRPCECVVCNLYVNHFRTPNRPVAPNNASYAWYIAGRENVVVDVEAGCTSGTD